MLDLNGNIFSVHRLDFLDCEHNICTVNTLSRASRKLEHWVEQCQCVRLANPTLYISKSMSAQLKSVYSSSGRRAMCLNFIRPIRISILMKLEYVTLIK